MTTWFIVMLVVFAAFKVVVASIPTSVVESLISKFELHPQLSEDVTSITLDGKQIEGEEKKCIIQEFNEAIFLEKYYFPPSAEGTPLMIQTKTGKTNVTFFIYRYDDHIDVIKQYKKKVVGYSLRSKKLQNPAMLVTEGAI
ncbi:YfmQ family protein [Bacillus cytotoxicus]|uniref:YfmQ n=2 Tax=Bacillus cytotoxicus TaxID=580165 RepID=A0AAX2CJ64_9BACI|nr:MULTISPECIES: YfmQ family protein [Bacillus cereus group]ABS22519.1 conserved hypothetical protein [Bacillus cytotoxicus NVH 391-98]AWC33164.1 hypothetical protein CG482_012720 [Bacillus cytotoxicus]AWC37189.1 hypothetical protein CG481_012735 [Bacillus cytotoxicus]AWC45171.1 hypothetical protein CG479_012205 [Bacillus cytotoxicus]AWC61455.1 hypothetical protein CG474_012795 [Bacillus cytotoxicus]